MKQKRAVEISVEAAVIMPINWGIPFYQIVHKAEKIEEFPGNCFIIPAKNFLMLTG